MEDSCFHLAQCTQVRLRLVQRQSWVRKSESKIVSENPHSAAEKSPWFLSFSCTFDFAFAAPQAFASAQKWPRKSCFTPSASPASHWDRREQLLWSPDVLRGLGAGTSPDLPPENLQLHHRCFHAELMGSSYPSSALHLPETSLFQTLGLGCVSQGDPSILPTRRAAARESPGPFTGSWVSITTPLINLAWQLVGQVLFPRALTSRRPGIFSPQPQTSRVSAPEGTFAERPWRPDLPCLVLPPSHSCKVNFRGKPSKFPRGILSQRQLSQKVVLIQDLALSQLKSPTKSLSPSVCPEPPVPCSAGLRVLLCSRGDPLLTQTHD